MMYDGAGVSCFNYGNSCLAQWCPPEESLPVQSTDISSAYTFVGYFKDKIHSVNHDTNFYVRNEQSVITPSMCAAWCSNMGWGFFNLRSLAHCFICSVIFTASSSLVLRAPIGSVGIPILCWMTCSGLRTADATCLAWGIPLTTVEVPEHFMIWEITGGIRLAV
ncbi:unnamed protein product [Choristocarpus tenellus]